MVEGFTVVYPVGKAGSQLLVHSQTVMGARADLQQLGQREVVNGLVLDNEIRVFPENPVKVQGCKGTGALLQVVPGHVEEVIAVVGILRVILHIIREEKGGGLRFFPGLQQAEDLGDPRKSCFRFQLLAFQKLQESFHGVLLVRNLFHQIMVILTGDQNQGQNQGRQQQDRAQGLFPHVDRLAQAVALINRRQMGMRRGLDDLQKVGIGGKEKPRSENFPNGAGS